MPWTGRTFRLGAIAAFCAALVAGIVAMAAEMRGPAGTERAPDAALEDPCPRPYAATSPWNTPIGSSPEVVPGAHAGVAEIEGPLTSDPTQYTYPVYEVDRRTPRRTVRVQGRFSDVSGDGRRLRIQDAGTVRLPLPDGARAGAGSDAQVILLDRDTGEEWGVWQLRRDMAGWQIENGYRYNVRWSGVPPHDAEGRPFLSRGAGVPYLAGLVRPCEIERGRIDHALAFGYDYPSPDHVYPATKSDGISDSPAALPEGTRLQLDPSLTTADLERRGCVEECLVIARALQEYGMYVIDNAGRPKVMLEYEWTARWGGQVNADTVSPIPLSAFRVVAAPKEGT